MKDYHTKPSKKVRSVEDALKDAERLRNELPRIVQVFARDWDKVILADRIAELEALIGKLKCCGNCKHQHDYICIQECHNLDKWERRRCFR